MAFLYHTEIKSDWIDYNGHMQDAFYGLVFSYAIDALQDAVGFDAAYRAATGCTIYLLECHTYFLKEVKQGDQVRCETNVLAVDAKRFHLHSVMYHGDAPVAVTEKMELHVDQNPTPHAADMPDQMVKRLQTACLTPSEIDALKHRARPMGFRK